MTLSAVPVGINTLTIPDHTVRGARDTILIYTQNPNGLSDSAVSRLFLDFTIYPPSIGVSSLSFTDTEVNMWHATGEITWTPPDDEAVDISSYMVYLETNADKNFQGEVPRGTNMLAIDATLNGFANILVYSKNSHGLQTNPCTIALTEMTTSTTSSTSSTTSSTTSTTSTTSSTSSTTSSTSSTTSTTSSTTSSSTSSTTTSTTSSTTSTTSTTSTITTTSSTTTSSTSSTSSSTSSTTTSSTSSTSSSTSSTSSTTSSTTTSSTSSTVSTTSVTSTSSTSSTSSNTVTTSTTTTATTSTSTTSTTNSSTSLAPFTTTTAGNVSVPTITTTFVAGSMTIAVSRPEQLVSDPQARMALTGSIADLAGVPSSYVTVGLRIVRRLTAWAGRYLQSGSVRLEYSVIVFRRSGTQDDSSPTPNAATTSITAALAALSPDNVTVSLSTALSDLGSEAYTIEVLEITEPVVEVRVEQVPIISATTMKTTTTTSTPTTTSAPTTSVATTTLTSQQRVVAQLREESETAAPGDNVGVIVAIAVGVLLVIGCMLGACYCKQLARTSTGKAHWREPIAKQEVDDSDGQRGFDGESLIVVNAPPLTGDVPDIVSDGIAVQTIEIATKVNGDVPAKSADSHDTVDDAIPLQAEDANEKEHNDGCPLQIGDVLVTVSDDAEPWCIPPLLSHTDGAGDGGAALSSYLLSKERWPEKLPVLRPMHPVSRPHPDTAINSYLLSSERRPDPLPAANASRRVSVSRSAARTSVPLASMSGHAPVIANAEPILAKPVPKRGGGTSADFSHACCGP
eukprot:gnl/TRDRNA2_/TRDRNA2_174331_c0_seq2.p1 gnl/TRDRNA2_/TRDRNA2_174331_c0~~gnl/TRDRNA2_/TRDRNA2_174331_c0_seq2.p1  ORF type:complete len:814 (+),score=72.67 gnl/TRDRNA2_/TRDRNA2_174331_c0_seq2:56-2443(+)